MNGGMNGWMDEWMDEWMDGWREEYLLRVVVVGDEELDGQSLRRLASTAALAVHVVDIIIHIHIYIIIIIIIIIIMIIIIIIINVVVIVIRACDEDFLMRSFFECVVFALVACAYCVVAGVGAVVVVVVYLKRLRIVLRCANVVVVDAVGGGGVNAVCVGVVVDFVDVV